MADEMFMYGYDGTLIKRVPTQHALNEKPRSFVDGDVDKLWKLRDLGFTYEQCSEAMDCSISLVKRTIAKGRANG